ncbi:MAG: ADP-ribosylation factor-like protein, partial [Promethearchaeota archaeon]
MQNFDEQTIDIFHKLNITKIRDFTNLTRDDILTLINEKKIDPIIVQNALIGANLIANAWNKRSEYVKKAKMKVVFTGLDFAGKTSLISRLLSDYNYSDTSKLEPTIGHIIEEYETERLNLIVWDLAGQKSNIEDYLAEPEKYFVQVDVLFFVIDAQDDLRYDLALKYLSDIIDILEFL